MVEVLNSLLLNHKGQDSFRRCHPHLVRIPMELANPSQVHQELRVAQASIALAITHEQFQQLVLHRQSGNPKQVHGKGSEEILAILQDPKASQGFLVVDGVPDDIRLTLRVPCFLSFASQASYRETLYLYLAVFQVAISSVLILEEDRVQKHICYTNRVL